MARLHQLLNVRKTAPMTYSASGHSDWGFGTTVFGGYTAAQLHRVAIEYATNDPAFKKLNQPDIQDFHVEFVCPCKIQDCVITAEVLKMGPLSSNLQLRLFQDDKLRAFAVATTTNLSNPVGPSVDTTWTLNPPLKPTPVFTQLLSGKSDDNWFPSCVESEVVRATSDIFCLVPKGGTTGPNICEQWFSWKGNEMMDASYLAVMSDFTASLPDTLMENGSLHDLNAFCKNTEEWFKSKPGPAIFQHTLKDAMKAEHIHYTTCMSFSFKRRLPASGIKWVSTRSSSKSMDGGRLDVDLEMRDEKSNLLCTVRQQLFVLETARKFKEHKSSL